MRQVFGWRSLVGSGLVLVGVLAVGCSTSDRPPISQLKQGLNLLDVRDPSWGMNAAFVKNDHVVYLETRLGSLKPDIYRQAWPNDPPNETDLRFLDQNGNTFYAQRGGDTFIDPTWQSDLDASVKAQLQINPADRAVDFELAKEAATAVGTAAPASFKSHVFYLKNFAAQAVPSKDPVMVAKAAELAKGITQEKPYAGWSSSGATWLETDLYSGSTGCFAWICTAKHSATIQWYSFDGWASYGIALNSCNHGRCYYDSGMSYQCYSTGGPFYYGSNISGEANSQYGGGTNIGGACLTPYSWNSGGYNHLCNDDAAYELWQAKSGSQWTSQGDGYSFVWYANANYACNCNNTGCDGDWSRPYCP
jgi:hypothetical protein